ncbi:HTH-type transcriptional activator [Vibrio crassostreae]|uniref:LysR family transcriptional regulator n=1 Tax=Vibrio TaxID=662 RepID=UPI0005E9A5C2|nr:MULTISPECIES: LysR family transcriptional regulator [Vibrio]PME26044.1 LysR family transcriptional regulator [Vibrio sp. 10N.286.55.E12]PME36786.1 LysR family transcriptional regulator [Vibrio sp. 10N.286.55.E10]PME69566.1 LysR family transcriptional regulator [Vibrio sp. 10N.286.55.C11]PTP13497.1 LysR family transcriptional regulator [Vibrio sp. 10N.286.51.C3]PTQ05226.1 LysR family transcriptional regulator [Vibrio sp. ZF 223]
MDLNLDIQNILVIKRMYELRNVSLVAESLGKTPGAISKNLAKLKAQLGDPLFIQSKQGFEPTTFVESNIGNFEQILSSIESIKHQEFSPESYQGDIKIYANTLFWERFGSKLYFALSKQAPHANYSFVRWGSNVKNRLIDGEESIAVHYFDETMPQSISQMEFGKEKVVFFVRDAHPAQEFASLANFPTVLFKTPGWNDNKYPILERLRNIGFDVTPKVEVDHPAMIHDVVLKSDYYGITLSGSVPEGCRSIDLPEKLLIDVSYVMSCRRSQQDAPLNQWLLRILKATLKNKQA